MTFSHVINATDRSRTPRRVSSNPFSASPFTPRAGLSFDVVLANGTLVTADACQNSDLFWALRGGGPGFGIITKVQYGLVPPTKIVQLELEYVPLASRGFLADTFATIRDLFGLTKVEPRDAEFTKRWISFVVDQVPNLEREWGGTVGPLQAILRFSGTLEEARNSDFVKAMDAWYESNTDLDFNYPKPSEMLEEFDSWYDHLGGKDAYQNPEFASSASLRTNRTRDTFSRVIPKQVFDDKPDELKEILIDLFTNHIQSNGNYLMGGAPNDAGATETAIHPNMRNAILMVEIATRSGAKMLRQFLEGYNTSVCYNHHSAEEPDWRDACWGSNYARLEEIKKKYDPGNLLNTFHGVGFNGVEFDNNDDTLFDSPTCQRNDEPIADLGYYIYSLGTWYRQYAPFLSPIWRIIDLFRGMARSIGL